MSGSDARLHLGLTDVGKVIVRGIGFIALAAFIVPALVQMMNVEDKAAFGAEIAGR